MISWLPAWVLIPTLRMMSSYVLCLQLLLNVIILDGEHVIYWGLIYKSHDTCTFNSFFPFGCKPLKMLSLCVWSTGHSVIKCTKVSWFSPHSLHSGGIGRPIRFWCFDKKLWPVIAPCQCLITGGSYALIISLREWIYFESLSGDWHQLYNLCPATYWNFLCLSLQ